METYSITSSSSYSHHRHHTIPAEAEQIMNTHKLNFMLHDDDEQVMETNNFDHAVPPLTTDRNTSGKTTMMTTRSREEEPLKTEDGGYGHDEEKDDGGKKPAPKGAEKKVRRPRFAFQTRSQVDILDDGYRWRKYGQKAVKNNNFPRSYYRCTHQGCNVKKQVQRLSKDEEVVVTTYEGTHTHPIERNNDNFEQILKQMQIYTTFWYTFFYINV